MFDDGNNDDELAGDNTFGIAIIIPEDCKEQNIDFYATATNTNDVIKFFPERAEFVFLSKEITQKSFESDIVINEFMASNKSTIQDENGGYADWIELYNKSSNSVSLKNWFITDDINKSSKWQFPDVSIDGNGYLLLWADEDKEQGDLHLNFKLSKSGEYIGLYDSDTNLIDFINFGIQSEDISEGRYPNGTGEFVKMTTPTPGTENRISTYIEENETLSNIVISPNPAGDYIEIKYMNHRVNPMVHEFGVVIYNALGECVKNLTPTLIHTPNPSQEGNGEGVFKVDVSDLSAGVYWLKFGKFIEKFIVVR
jgi:hypothetical protein